MKSYYLPLTGLLCLCLFGCDRQAKPTANYSDIEFNAHGPCCFRGSKKISCEIAFDEQDGPRVIRWEDGLIQAFQVKDYRAFNDILYVDKDGKDWEYYLSPSGDVGFEEKNGDRSISMPLRDRYCE